MQIGVIIPTLNEEKNIAELLSILNRELREVKREIIVVDAASIDNTVRLADKCGARVLPVDQKCCAFQMNRGAQVASGEILYFVHADSRPPKGFFHDILQAFHEGFDIGCFRFKFDSSKVLLKINAYFTRFDREMCRGGDQTFFIKRFEFNRLGGYNERLKIMEEYAFMRKARKELKFKIIPKDVIVSARKYEENSYFRVNLVNLVIFASFNLGVSQNWLVKMYKKLLIHPKVEVLE